MAAMISSSSGASRSCEPRSVVSRGNSLIPHLCHHASLHMVEIVAVECPPARIVGVEGDPHPSWPGHDQHGIAHGALDRPPVDRDYLECVAVQMDRMRHHCAVDQLKLHTLPLPYHERRDVRPHLSVHRPGIGLHAAAERDGADKIRGTRAERLCGGEPRDQLTQDDVLDNITLYWLTNTGI